MTKDIKDIERKWDANITEKSGTHNYLDESWEDICVWDVPWGDDGWEDYLPEEGLEFIGDLIEYKLQQREREALEEYTEWLRWHCVTGGASAVPVENPVIWLEQYLTKGGKE